MSMIAFGRDGARALDPALDAPFPPAVIPSRAPIALIGGLSWPPPRRVWRWAPVIVLGEWGVFYVLDRLVAAHMGAG